MQPPPSSRRPQLSSLPLQIIIFFGWWYDVFYWIVEFLVFLHKGTKLPYKDSTYSAEFVVLFLWLLVEPGRLFLATKGNKAMQKLPLFYSVLLAGPTIALYVYYIVGQTFVLKIDQVLNATALAITALQVVLSVIAAVSFPA